MALAEEIAAAVGKSLAPIVDNAVARISQAAVKQLPAELAKRLSGKKIQFTSEITLPDLTESDDK